MVSPRNYNPVSIKIIVFLLVIIIAILIAVIIMSVRPKYIEQALDKQFSDFFETGEYDLVGHVIPTKIFPDGLSYKALTMIIKRSNSVIKESKITGYNSKNNNKLYEGLMIDVFDIGPYGSVHFRKKKFIDNKLKSLKQGFVTQISPSSITYQIQGDCYLTGNHEYLMIYKLKKVNNGYKGAVYYGKKLVNSYNLFKRK